MVAPQVTWGTSPEHVVAVDGSIPDPASEGDPVKRRAMEGALAYMGLEPGGPIAGTKVDWVFIGSCTNGRLSDLREAAKVARGGRVADGVNAWVVPGSEIVKRDAEAEGLDRVVHRGGLRMAGAWLLDVLGRQMAKSSRRASVPSRPATATSSAAKVPRARTHLASPAMAAAAALAGAITDVRNVS